jgi:hypothetical protein
MITEQKLNKGIGAGGKNTNINGITFENKTSIEEKLLNNDFKKITMNKKTKYGYFFEFINKNYKIIYLTQTGFKLYFKKYFNIDTYKCPDEAFLIFHNGNIYLKILEKKNQNVNGSVEDKLKTGKFNKTEYEKMLNITNINFNVNYAFCVSNFLQLKLQSKQIKYINMVKIMNEDNIKIFFGDEINYYNLLYDWIFEL